MARINILTNEEKKEFNSPPIFTYKDREHYFYIRNDLLKTLYERVKLENIAYVILQYGYFRASSRFFKENYNNKDLEYIVIKYDLRSVDTNLSSSAYDRYRQLIKELLSIQNFNKQIEQNIETRAVEFISEFKDRKKIFYLLIDYIKSLKIELPSYSKIIKIFSRANSIYKESLVNKLEKYKDELSLKELERFLDKDENYNNQYNINRYKSLEHNTEKNKIKESIEKYKFIKNLYESNKHIIEYIKLTSEIASYYSIWIEKSKNSQVNKMNKLDQYFHLLSFVYHQYMIRTDNLIDRLISVVQSSKTTIKRNQNSYEVEQSPQKDSSIKNLEDNSLSIINEINRITSLESSDSKKIELINEFIDHKSKELVSIMSRVSDIPSFNESKYNLMESKSKAIQGKLSQIVKEIEFDKEASNKGMMEAVEYFISNKVIGQKAPIAFLEENEIKLIFTNDRVRVSLYKILLIYAISNSIKMGTLNLKHSYKYKSLESYLIDKNEWDNNKENIISIYGLSSLKEPKDRLSILEKVINDKYKNTNDRITKGLNIHFKETATSFTLKTPKVEKDDENDNISLYFPTEHYISIIKLLRDIDDMTGFLSSLTHLNNKSFDKLPKNVLIAAIVGFGCNINLSRIGKISKGINPNQLDSAKTWYFSEDNTIEANDKIIEYMDNLDVIKLLRYDEDINHTSSDGQKVNMKSSVASTNAGYSFKYFGTGKGVSVYTFIDESHRLFYSTVINANERESGYVIDGLLHNNTVKSDIHSTDTHGYSEVIFALTHLLGFSFAPRIKNFKDQQLYSFVDVKDYKELEYKLLPRSKIKVDLIVQYWDDILRFVATIKSRKSTASQLLYRLTTYTKQHKLYQALKEFGKIIKTEFLLTYIDDVELRQRIEKQLNKVEASNKFSRAIFFGDNSEIQVSDKEEQNIANNCKRIIQNAIILWNYHYMSQKLKNVETNEEKETIVKAIKNSSIMHWSHVNLYGEYDFTEIE